MWLVGSSPFGAGGIGMMRKAREKKLRAPLISWALIIEGKEWKLFVEAEGGHGLGTDPTRAEDRFQTGH